MLPSARLDEAESLGASLVGILRVAAQDEPRLHAKMYLVGLQNGGRVTRVAIVGSANPTGCGLSRQHELSTLLVEDEASHSLFDWLQQWFSDIWDRGVAYVLPTTPPARPDGGRFAPLPFQETVLDWLNERWEEAPGEPVRVLRGNEVRLPGHLIVLPTGTGKTRLTLEWVGSKWKNHEDIAVLWVTHLGELVKQTQRHFLRLLNHGPEGRRYTDGEWRDGTRRLQTPEALRVLTRQKAARMGPAAVDILVIDEAHHVGFGGVQYPAMLSDLRARMVIGLTATPWRTPVGGVDDSSLDALFPDDDKHRCEPITLAEATDPAGGPVLAHLCRYVIDTGLTMELSEEETSFRVSAGDRTFDRFLTPEAVRLVAAAWFGGLGKTLVFALTKQHADDLAAEFRRQHSEARVLVVHSGQDDDESDANLSEFRHAKENDQVVLVSVAMLLEGIDFPDATTVVMARPTRSTLLYTQMLGRVLRGPAISGTQRAFALEFFIRTRADESAAPERVRGELFRRALLAPPRSGVVRKRHWDPSAEWGAELKLPPDVERRVLSARRALPMPTRTAEVARVARRSSSGGWVRITANTLLDMYYDWHPGFRQVAKMTGIAEETLKVYAYNDDLFERWRANNQDVLADVRKVVAKFRSRHG
jgi:hypothetical protein